MRPAVKVVAAYAACLGGLSAAFWAGRTTKPAKVETKIEQKVEYVDRVVEKVVEVKVRDATSSTRTDKTKVTNPDGSTVEHEHTAVDVGVYETSEAKTDRDSGQVAVVDDQVEQKVVTSSGPEWFAGAVLVFSPQAFTLDDPRASMAAGVSVGRRLFGPVSVGITATVPVASPLTIPTFGILLSAGF